VFLQIVWTEPVDSDRVFGYSKDFRGRQPDVVGGDCGILAVCGCDESALPDDRLSEYHS
jgi:hypothetical protein